MLDVCKTIEISNDNIFLDLGNFYGQYIGSFFYYQQKRIIKNENIDEENYSIYIFHLNKSDCTEKDENGQLLPILMCYICDKGMALPDEIFNEIKRHENKVYLYFMGYADFALSVKNLAKSI